MYAIPAKCIPKPKGMHWRTFARHIERLKRVERQALGDLEIVFQRLGLSDARKAPWLLGTLGAQKPSS